MKKKFAIVFLSLCLVLSLPFAAHANIVTATGRYLITAVKHVAGGAKVTATNTATGAKHVATHGVSAPALGFAIGAGLVTMGTSTGVGFAFQAITGLALDGVDWVMDPANNRIKYTERGEGWMESSYPQRTASSASQLCQIIHPDRGRYTFLRIDTISSTSSHCVYSDVYSQNPIKINILKTSVPSEEKYISLDTLAEKILKQADAGQVDSQKTIEDYVTHLAKEGKLDTELDNSSDITPSEEPENPEEPNPEEPQECPSGTVKLDNVCVKIPDSDGDEPLFCDSSEFTKKVCDWIDWTQEEPEEVTPEQIDIKEVDADNSNKIDMAGECPSPYELNFAVLGYEQNHSISYEPLCGALVLLKPIFVGSGALSGMFILMGYSRASNTGVN